MAAEEIHWAGTIGKRMWDWIEIGLESLNECKRNEKTREYNRREGLRQYHCGFGTEGE